MSKILIFLLEITMQNYVCACNFLHSWTVITVKDSKSKVSRSCKKRKRRNKRRMSQVVADSFQSVYVRCEGSEAQRKLVTKPFKHRRPGISVLQTRKTVDFHYAHSHPSLLFCHCASQKWPVACLISSTVWPVFCSGCILTYPCFLPPLYLIQHLRALIHMTWWRPSFVFPGN